MTKVEEKFKSDGVDCCTPKGQIRRHIDCKGCDKKPLKSASFYLRNADKTAHFVSIRDAIAAIQEALDSREKELQELREGIPKAIS